MTNLTRNGTLCAAINLGNPLLAQRDATTGAVTGVSIDLAQALAQELGAALELQVFDTASQSVDAVTRDLADVGFFAIDPVRGAGIAFTAPYLLIEGSYLVRSDSPLQANDQVDAPGVRVTVGKGSAYDLFLTRSLALAQIVRAASSQAVLDEFLAQGLEVAAGIRQQLQEAVAQRPGLRLLPGRFMVIEQAMGCPKSRGPQAAQALQTFVESMKASGFIAAALARHGISGARVA
jgi:polar amino acid transport system substrate-binding protein